ncbi:hypothetical protein BDZ94DRAFT_1157316 [Collybia nuda]|uniref:Meiotically up-regulated protein Msb1/Mug8 domain-containing protein n=1 Tax=Collybia nuda TaxID=64659 RepID=A0A9P5YDB5_9AGAR|nr:hypothetical protein BDZ94DRAFT_1157316 [Collybia nuda]
MPSLFSRSRTNSTPKKHSLNTPEPSGAFDEFGRVSSRLSNFAAGVGSPSPASKKDKKKAKEQEKRLRTLSTTRERAEYDQGNDAPLSPFPDGTFLPLNLERPRNELGAIEYPKEHDYGFLSYERHVVLGLEQVARLVEVVSEELGTRGGITTPFIFSTTALDISSSAIKRLIRTFLNTCMINSGLAAEEAETRWREEARFAEPHELGMCLRWGLARVVRSVGGQDVRGLISWEHYIEFRDSEGVLGYPPAHFATFLPTLVPPLQSIIITVLTLLSRLTANSTTSGHTPPTLSPLFGPLMFGLGPATLAFHHTYIHYLRAVNAMEHILLAFIRWQDSPRISSNDPQGALNLSGSAAALGVPTRLKEWIKGYPSMLPFLQEVAKNQKPQARRGARTVRVMSVRRNVRMYSPDLVKSAATWAHRNRSMGPVTGENGLAVSKEWERVAPPTLKLPPRYSEAYKKRMDMPAHFHPETGPGSALSSPPVSNAPSYSSNTSSGTSASLLGDQDYFGLGLGGREGEDRFRSLTDLRWGEFESMGFSGLGDEKKLQFDLTESARTERTAKRATLSWNDFSSAGFTRSDAPLSATLQFSSPVSKTISSWPTHNAEMSKKLKKTQKALPAFGWDTEPVVGNEEVIEEAFVDVFCDLVYGGGWMDLERYEELDRDCNWALVEFKSLPPSRTTASGGSDPRTSTTLILFEEFVPLEYRQQLAVTSSTRRRLPSLFSQSGKSKQWKQAATLNGRPYVVGHVPRSPSYREVEFEGLLRGGSATKVISLGSKASMRAPPSRALSTVSNAIPEVPSASRTVGISSPLYVPTLEVPSGSKSEEMHSDSTMSPSMSSTKRMSRFRLPGGIPVPSPGGSRKTGMVPAEYSSVDFETRLASYSDDEYNGVMESEAVKQKRRQSKDDAWVDILVGTQSRRIGGQDAELTSAERRRGLRGRRSDPEMASMEVAQVLAAVRDRTPTPPSVHERVDQDYGLDYFHDQDVDEIETVPRTSEARTEDDTIDYSAELDLDDEALDDEVDQPVISARHMARQQRRLGYFDLHPERRPQPVDPPEDDPRDRLAYDDESADEMDEDNPPEHSQLPTVTPRKLPTPPSPRVAPETPVPVTNEHQLEPLTNTTQNGNGSHEPKPATPSKTAALIEMYRERERGVPSKPTGPIPAPIPVVIAPLQPSRLPVRTASLPKEAALPTQELPVATPSPKPLSNPSPSLETGLIEPPRVALDETGRASPARYVHGAPLHNVLEEEEEEV